jgi:hypothetical protein
VPSTPGRVQQFKLAEQAAGLQFLVAFEDCLNPWPNEPPHQRQHVQDHGDGIDILRARGTGLIGAGTRAESHLGDHHRLAGRQQRLQRLVVMQPGMCQVMGSATPSAS